MGKNTEDVCRSHPLPEDLAASISAAKRTPGAIHPMGT
jgi:hypothetical protein